MYVLDSRLQAQHHIPKWNSRARLGVYLGPIQSQSRSVSLALNLRTRHVSLQLHLKHDDFFEMVSKVSINYDSPEATSKQLSRLTVLSTPRQIPNQKFFHDSFHNSKSKSTKTVVELLCNILVFPKAGTGINFNGAVVAQGDAHFENSNFVIISKNAPKNHNSLPFVSAHA